MNIAHLSSRVCAFSICCVCFQYLRLHRTEVKCNLNSANVMRYEKKQDVGVCLLTPFTLK